MMVSCAGSPPENNVSATAFVLTGEDGYELRWFTPVCEIKLCGHATLAAAHVLLTIRQTQLDSVNFKTRFRGNLTVRSAGDCLAMDFPAMLPTTLQDRARNPGDSARA